VDDLGIFEAKIDKICKSISINREKASFKDDFCCNKKVEIYKRQKSDNNINI